MHCLVRNALCFKNEKMEFALHPLLQFSALLIRLLVVSHSSLAPSLLSRWSVSSFIKSISSLFIDRFLSMLSIVSYRERLLHRLRAVCAVDCREIMRECRDALGASRVAVPGYAPNITHHHRDARGAPTSLPHNYYDASLCANGKKHQVILSRLGENLEKNLQICLYPAQGNAMNEFYATTVITSQAHPSRVFIR